MTYVTVAFAATALVARVIVPMLITRHQRWAIARGQWQPGHRTAPHLVALVEAGGDAGRLGVVFLVQRTVAAALIAGAASALLATYLVEHWWISTALAAGMLVLVALQFPTKAGASQWIEAQLAVVNEERQFLGRQ
jgi:hypothetical protein